MVKRPKTPEAPEVAKYYTCCYPYPNNADFEDPKDYIAFARWISNILGNNGPLCAIYFKPKSRGKVIFSVDKEYPRPERLLGEHRWNEFLKKPKRDEVGLKSQIFYCTYNKDRDVQKDGWKCISVEDFFFANFGIDKWFTKVPYPAPHWCPPAVENPTEKPLCRPLPSAQVPPPQPSAPPQRQVVGSSDWSQARDKAANSRGNVRNDASQKKPAAGAAKKTAAQRANTAPNQSSFPPLSAAPPGKKAQSPSPATNNGSVWGNKPPSVASAAVRPSPFSAPPTSTAHTMWTVKHAKSRAGINSPSTSSSAKSASAPTPQQPKSAAAAPAKNINSKGEDLDGRRAKDNKTPARNSSRAGQSWRSTSPTSSSGGSTTASAPSSAPSSPTPSSARDQELVDFDASVYDFDDDYDEEITDETYHESWETTSSFAPSEPPPAPAVRLVGNNGAKGKGREYSHPFVKAVEQEIGRPTEETNLWANVKPVIRSTGTVTAMVANANEKNELICPVHGGKCKRGICEAYKEFSKAKKKQAKAVERKAKKEQKKEEEADDWDTKDEQKDEWKEKEEDGDMKDHGKARDEGKKDDADENATEAVSVDNKQVKQDIGQSSKAKSRRWDEYGSTDEEDYYDHIPSFPPKTGGRKFYDDDDYFE